MITASGQNEGDPLPQTDDSKGSAPLPRSELNPLLNPLLGQNMGRWAEVYYTSPPEMREQAVQELVRELEAQQMEAQQTVPQERSFSHEEHVPVEHAPVNDLPSFRPASSEPRASEPLLRRQAMDPETWSTDFLPRAGADQQSFGAKIWDSKLAAGLRRRSLLAAFVIVIFCAMVLGYRMRVGAPSPATSGAQQNPPAMPAPASPTTQSGAPAGSKSVANSASQLQPAGEPVAAAPAPHAPAKPVAGERSTTAATSTAIPAATTLPPSVSKGAGSEELAVAKNYLNGNGSTPRDTEEAAKWLWKAVAKKNAEATGLLATLYLEGDGIPKNCDQARLLLDAAARKGIKGAAERLGHLQAFGCQ